MSPSRLVALSVALLAPCVAAAQPAPPRPFLWRLADADSRVYLLGSVHALPAGTDVLPGAAADAYDDAEALAFEVDLDAAPSAVAGALALARATDGVALSKRLGPADADRLRARLARLGIDLSLAETFQPWFVGVMLGAGEVSEASAAAGVDVVLSARARQDGKARLSLETADEQLAALSGLPIKAQVAFLRAALDDGASGLDDMVAAWRAGDDRALEALLDEGLNASPALRRSVLVERNARWVPQIEAFLDRTGASGRPEDVLVVVGAAHLLGADSVVEMLRARGLSVERVGD